MVLEKELVQFMARGRSARSVAKKFDISIKEAAKKIKAGFKDHDVFPGPKDVHGERTFVAVPLSGEVPDSSGKRCWTWQQEPNGQPYGVVTFPKSFEQQKIRLIPLDGILYGDQSHDTKRFNAVLKRIADEDNTFCFLNGDTIADITGGTREERESILLDRTNELQEKLLPIAHKIIWAQSGCTERRSLRQQGFDPLQYMCKKLDIPHFSEPVYIDIFWGDQMFTLWAMHGHSTAQVKGARMNSLRRPAQLHEYLNFIISGHVGDALVSRNVKTIRDTVNCVMLAKEEYHVVLPNFIKYLGTTSAVRGNTPPSRDMVVLYMYANGKHHVKTQSGRES